MPTSPLEDYFVGALSTAIAFAAAAAVLSCARGTIFFCFFFPFSTKAPVEPLYVDVSLFIFLSRTALVRPSHPLCLY